jgi:N-acetylmuramoyl-L-alanine amidase
MFRLYRDIITRADDSQHPLVVEQPLPSHYGRGRPCGLKPTLIVIHLQEGYGNPWHWFRSLPQNGIYRADCTIWNPRDADAKLYRFLRDEDAVWNGICRFPFNRDNSVLDDLWRRGVYSGDITLSIEHEGFASEGISEAQLQRTILICTYWCKKWSIPPDSQHIVGHSDIGAHRHCPGRLFPFDRLIEGVRRLLGWSEYASID